MAHAQAESHGETLLELGPYVQSESHGETLLELGPRSTVYVRSDGIAFPCSNCMSNKAFGGWSVREHPFEDVWEGGFDAIRSFSFADFALCKLCPVENAGVWCQFRCPPLSQNVTGINNGCGATEYLRMFMLKAHAFWENRRSEGIRLRL